MKLSNELDAFMTQIVQYQVYCTVHCTFVIEVVFYARRVIGHLYHTKEMKIRMVWAGKNFKKLPVGTKMYSSNLSK
jgi:hypothetical protein